MDIPKVPCPSPTIKKTPSLSILNTLRKSPPRDFIPKSKSKPTIDVKPIQITIHKT